MYKNHINFGLWQGVELMALSEHLMTRGSRMAHLKIISREDIDARLIQRLVRAALKLNATGRDTKRAQA